MITMPKWLRGLDIKSWALIILSALLILSWVFGPKKIIELNKDEINRLHKDNKVLQTRYDSLEKENKIILMRMKDRDELIQSKDAELSDAQSQIDALKNRRAVIKNEALSLNANAVSDEFTKYLKNRKP
jgi:peptidoglycan hydrolase CwlO-like protein